MEPPTTYRSSPAGVDAVGSGGRVAGQYVGEHDFGALVLIVVFDREFLPTYVPIAFVRGKFRPVLRGKLLPLALVLGLAADIQNRTRAPCTLPRRPCRPARTPGTWAEAERRP